MAEINKITTRISLKYDSFARWYENNPTLLSGELAIAYLGETKDDTTVIPDNGTHPVLFKVGPGKFNDLPWASALAADVYDWAKAADVVVEDITDTEGKSKKELVFKNTNEDVIKRVDLSSLATAADVKTLSDEIKGIRDSLGIGDDNTGDETVQGQIVKLNEALNSILGTGEGEDRTPGLIETTVADAVDEINSILGGEYTAEEGKTVADAIAKVASDAENAVKALSEENGAIYALDQRTDALEDRFEGFGAEETIKTAITDAINALDSVNAGELTEGAPAANTVVKGVTQADGKVTVTYGKLALADLPTLTENVIPEIHANKVVVADETGDLEKVTLDTKLTNIDEQIKGITDAIAGGVHFIGTVDDNEDLTDGEITVNDRAYTANAGDVIIQKGQEYIWTGANWEPLGDISRIGALETKLADLDVTDAVVENQFVTAVSQSDGKISISRARPTAAAISYGDDSNVNAELVSLDGRLDAVEDRFDGFGDDETIKTAITDAITTELGMLDATTTGEGAFVTSVTQENGKVTVTKGDLPTASSTVAGITTLGVEGGAATYEVVDALATQINGNGTGLVDKLGAVEDRTDSIEADYLRVNDKGELFHGKAGTTVLIIDCGSSSIEEE